MTAPLYPQNESARLSALAALHILDTPIEERFERVVRLARERFDVSISAFNLIDQGRQWSKAAAGGSLPDIPRLESFCAHTIGDDHVLAVSDARDDPRFAENPFVTSGKVLFYAGCPVRSPDGHPVGSLCIADAAPRLMTAEDMQALRDFGVQIEEELRRTPKTISHELAKELTPSARRSLLDPLTGTWNEDGLAELLRREWSAAECNAGPLTLCVVEFDTGADGAPGKACLAAAARRLLTALRDEDSIGDDGKGRLMVIMPGCSFESAAQAGATLRQALAKTCEASLGLTSCRPGTGQGIESILRRVEGAVAIARRSRGNRVAVTAQAGHADRRRIPAH